ncbi:TPA: T6SS effector phospholipase Tle3 domain-containing protein [Burkholderia orbicola]
MFNYNFAQNPGGQPSTDDPSQTSVGGGLGTTLFNRNDLECVMQMPLPGVVIFVHGVNSEGEWFKEAEKGLCAGLNRRMGRYDDQLFHWGPVAGQMTPVSYIESLTPDGFLNPDMSSKTYITPDPSFSPVIHFRWGYAANAVELKEYGDKIMLNEKNYWGGGPFAGGCSSLPDLWNDGLNDRLFLWLTVQHMNGIGNRKIYSTPPRTYGVLGALRLARLVESIRKRQADAPITIVCHSQGNMIGLAAAFLGDRLPEVTDQWGKKGRCVADTYVLANPPYSLVEANMTDSWAQRGVRDKNGHVGRETYVARKETLRAYFDILRARAELEMPAEDLDRAMENARPSKNGGKPYSAAKDREAHGLYQKNTYGRVTLYCCPHDQVISALTVQGIGWRGMSVDEISATNAWGVFSQRVFASNFEVGGENKLYRYWQDDWRKDKNQKEGFWYPPSPPARYGLGRGVHSNEGWIAKFFTIATSPALYLFNLTNMPVNEDPPKDWEIPITAPMLDKETRFLPQALRYGKPSGARDAQGKPIEEGCFNEGYDPPSAGRDANKENKRDDDPYDNFDAKSEKFKTEGDALKAQGDAASEAAQRYEDHSILRMEARRLNNRDWVDENGVVVGEDRPADASEDYKKWRNKEIFDILNGGDKNNPTNHSTIMTNSEHAEKALAYDIAIGLCYLTEGDFADLRKQADWRFLSGLVRDGQNELFAEYIKKGKYKDMFLHKWVKSDPIASMPEKIYDERDGGFFLRLGSVL